MREPCKPRNLMPARSGLREHWECRAVGLLVKAYVDVPALELTDVELPGVLEDGMSGRNGQRKPGSARGWPRRSRTAKASRINRSAAKSRGARERGGWGQLSVDGPEQHNPDRSEDPRGRWSFSTAWRCSYRVDGSDFGRIDGKHEGRRQTGRRSVYAGSRLKLTDVPGRSRLICQP